jgi:hypothetical protein
MAADGYVTTDRTSIFPRALDRAWALIVTAAG